MDSLGTETELTGIARDIQEESGLDVASEGVQRERVLTLVFTKQHLAAKGVDIDPTGYFVIDGERWDLTQGDPILDMLTPLGAQEILEVSVRRAREAETAAEQFSISIEE